MASEKLGRVGYEAYNAHQGGHTYDGKPIPSWDENKREDIKAAWNVASEAIADAVIDDVRRLLNSAGASSRYTDAVLDEARRRYGARREGSRPAITRSGDAG